MLLAGPFTGRLLGDMGAEIIKVEPPGKPDPLREWGKARYKGRSLWWGVQSRNKKCVTLDLRTGKGQELLLELAKHSDVVVENFRPGTLERWNIGWAELHEANPRLVLCRVSGYGQTGPYAERAGFASAAEAMGGIRHINGFPGEPPPRLHISLGDSLAGMFAAQGILAALYRRDALGGGEGQVVDVSLLESCFALLESTVPEYDRLGIVRGPGGTGLKGVAPSNIFRSRDDTWIVIAANADNVFARLCAAMGTPELAEDERFSTHLARGDNQDEIEGIIAEWAGRHDVAEIDRILNEAGVICGPIYTVADMFEDEHFWAREMLLEHEDAEFGKYVGPGIAPKFSDTPGRVRWSGTWEHGSHNHEVYGGLLGLSDEELADLAGGGRPVTVTICDVGPRDGLQNEPTTLAPRGARRARQPSRRRRPPPHRGRQLREPEARPADGRRRGGGRGHRAARRRRLRRARAQRARLRPAGRGGSRRGALRLRGDRDVQPAQPERERRGVGRRRRADRGPRGRATGSAPRRRSASPSGARSRARSSPDHVAGLAERLASSFDEVVFADTVGVAVPRQIGDVLGRADLAGTTVGIHLHNTRNTGYANALAAIEAGATVLDASIGGIGGCPFAPRATGNIATEDLVYLLDGEGIETGIDLDALTGVAEWLEGVLGRPLEGHVYRAGTLATLAG